MHNLKERVANVAERALQLTLMSPDRLEIAELVETWQHVDYLLAVVKDEALRRKVEAVAADLDGLDGYLRARVRAA